MVELSVFCMYTPSPHVLKTTDGTSTIQSTVRVPLTTEIRSCQEIKNAHVNAAGEASPVLCVFYVGYMVCACFHRRSCAVGCSLHLRGSVVECER